MNEPTHELTALPLLGGGGKECFLLAARFRGSRLSSPCEKLSQLSSPVEECRCWTVVVACTLCFISSSLSMCVLYRQWLADR